MLKSFDIPIGWGELLKRTAREFSADNCLGLAAQLAYYLLLALVPAIVFLLALTSFVPGDTIQQAIDAARAFMPADMLTLLEDQLLNIAEGQNSGLLTFGFLMALWSSSAAVVAIVGALNQVYDIEDARPWWKVRLTAILLTLALAVLVIVASGLVLVGPTLATWLADLTGFGAVFEWTWKIVQWPLVFLLITIAIGMVNYVGPDAEQDWTWITPGALLATVLWLLASLAFKFYVSNFADYNQTYGPLGGAILLMLWFYISGLAVLAGAEMNAEIEHASPHGKDPGEKVPGQRKKIGAAAARDYEERHKRQPAPARSATPARAYEPAPGSTMGRLVGLPVFLAMWFRRRKVH